MRRKIIALSTLIAVCIAILAPTAAIAAPRQRHHQQTKQVQRHTTNMKQSRFRSMADQERRVNPKLQRERDRVTNPGMHQFDRRDRAPQPSRNQHRGAQPKIRHDEHRRPEPSIRRGEHHRSRYEHRDYHRIPRFEHRGRHYHHGYYRGFYRGYWRTWHSEDWIRAIGIAAFVSMILDNRANFIDGYDYIYDRYGNVVAVIERY